MADKKYMNRFSREDNFYKYRMIINELKNNLVENNNIYNNKTRRV
jgi:rRNA maturation protein Nop10